MTKSNLFNKVYYNLPLFILMKKMWIWFRSYVTIKLASLKKKQGEVSITNFNNSL